MRKRIPRRHGYRYRESPSILRPIIGLAFIAVMLFMVGSFILRLFGVGNTIAQAAATLIVEGRSGTRVSIEGGDFKRAENDQKIFPGDTIVTDANGYARLEFFDGTEIRLDELSSISIDQSYKGLEESRIRIKISDGGIWVRTPTLQEYSGAILRSIETPILHITLPTQSEVVARSRSLVVFAADGIGATIEHKQGVIPVIVGEGQRIALPSDITDKTDLYTFRSPIDPEALQSSFVTDSRTFTKEFDTEAEESTITEEHATTDPLAVIEPANDITVQESVIAVKGTIQKDVKRVRVNGYTATINEEEGTFYADLALPEQDNVEIIIAALNGDGDLMSEVRRHITRDRKPPNPPTILTPAGSGQTFRTLRSRFTIEGEASLGTAGIIVNDYRLQLFSPGDRKWSYLASTTIDNLKPGKNVYNVIAINEGGYKSEPTVLTILLEEGPEGIVQETTENSVRAPENAEPIEEEQEQSGLKDNDPIQPGSLTVFAPSPGLEHTATGSNVLIEGKTSTATDSIWVNGYRLRLYEPGKDFWNYIADIKLSTMRRGRNRYHVVARDQNGRVLDKLTYSVLYRPGRLDRQR